MKQSKIFQNYTEKYLSLNTPYKYSIYTNIYKYLYSYIQNTKYNNILFINKAAMDVDFIALLSDVNKFQSKKLYLSGIKFSTFSYKYYYNQILDLKQDYDFVDGTIQSKFNPISWKINKKKLDQIELILVPVQIVSGTKKQCIINNTKLLKFIKKFKKAKIIGIGYHFALISKDDFLNIDTKNILEIDDFISFNIETKRIGQ